MESILKYLQRKKLEIEARRKWRVYIVLMLLFRERDTVAGRMLGHVSGCLFGQGRKPHDVALDGLMKCSIQGEVTMCSMDCS
jgi:hypothetical protein